MKGPFYKLYLEIFLDPFYNRHKFSWVFHFYLYISMEFTCVGIGGRCYVVYKRQKQI